MARAWPERQVTERKCDSAAVTTVNSGTGSTTLLAANSNRKGATIENTDANVLYVDCAGDTASSTNFTKSLDSDEYWEVPFGFTGKITGIWAGDGSGKAVVTEFTGE